MSERDWKQTPTLDDFAAMYDEDDNLWWRIDSGHHLNLYEAAVERYENAEAAIERVRELWTTCSCDRCTTNHLAILRALDGDNGE